MKRKTRRPSPMQRPLNLVRLEEREVPAYTATLSGSTATFVGNSSGASGDIVVFSQSGGFLIHNRGILDAGFESEFDFNSTVAGDQKLAANTTSLVNLTTGSGPEVIQVGGQVSSASTISAASTLQARFNLIKAGSGNARITVNDGFSSTGRTFTFSSNAVSATGVDVSISGSAFTGGITLVTGTGNDVVNVTSVLGFANGLEPRTVRNKGGNDTVSVGSAAGSLDGFAGQPITVDGSAGTTAIVVNDVGDAGSDVYRMTATDLQREDGVNDTDINFSGTGVSISVLTGAGNDTITLANGADLNGGTIDGGANTDMIDFTNFTTAVTVNLVTGTATASGGVSGIENVTGSAAADTLTGNNSANVLIGGLGNDTIDGGSGDDVITGGDGDDTMFGGSGNDSFLWNPGDDNDVIDGQADVDTMTFNGSAASEVLSLSANGSRLIFLRNIAAVTMDIGTVETFVFNGINGSDQFTVNDTSGVADLNRIDLNGGNSDDIYQITPSSNVVVNVTGNTHVTGDTVSVVNSGLSDLTLTFTETSGANAQKGFFAATGRQNVNFQTVEAASISTSVSVSDVTIDEAASTANFTVTLSSPSAQTVSVDFSTQGLSALAGEDYTSATGTVTFAPGETSKTITIAILDDTIDEPDQTFNVTLSNPTNASLADDKGLGTIIDNDAAPTISVNSVTATEGGSLFFTVSLSTASQQTVTYHVETKNGTAIAPDDFTATSGNFTFNPGQTSIDFGVSVFDDTVGELTETMSVELSNVINATVSNGVGTGTILDNDNLPPTISDISNQSSNSLSIGPVAFTVNDLNAGATLTLSASSTNTALIANNAIGFGGSGNNRTIILIPTAGQTGTSTITVTVTDDAGATATDSFTVTINPPTNLQPSISDVSNQIVPFGGFSAVVPFFVTDVETPAANLTVTAVSSNPALVSDAGIVFGGTGTNRNFFVSPNAGVTGITTITVTVADGNGGTATDTFTVTVDAPAPLPAPPAGVTVQEAAGANTASIQGAVDAFRALIGGGTTPGAAGSFGGVRREINWDAVPATKLNPFPGDFFNTTSKRGVLLSTDGTGLAVSGNAGTPQFEFADLNAQGPAEFSSFSSPKLFTSLGSTTYDIEFRMPGTEIPAGVNAFGVVFTDVDLANVSKLEFFDAAGSLLVSRDVLPTGVTSEGLSFLGIQLPAWQLAAKVRVTTGNQAIDAQNSAPPKDIVAVDDFIFSEPVPLPPDQRTDIFAVGSGPGVEAQVNVFNADGNLRFALLPFPGFKGGVTVSTGDVNGDGFDDVAVGAGEGGGPHVKIFDGETGQLIKNYFAYDPSFTAGIFVGLGDVNRDGRADLVTGTGPGGGPHVRVFDGVSDAVLHNFFAYEESFRGGVSVRAGDTDGDGFADVITGAGPGGGPRVRVFDGVDLSVLQDFFAAEESARDGVLVGTADFIRQSKVEFEIIATVGNRIGLFGITDGTSNTKYIEQDNLVISGNGTRIAPAAIRLIDGTIGLLIGSIPTAGQTLSGRKTRVIDFNGNDILNFDPLDSTFLGGVSVG